MITEADVAAITPEFWANEAIGRLNARLVFSRLVRRDFEPLVASVGQTVHIPKRGVLGAVQDKVPGLPLTVYSPASESVPITLNKQKVLTWAVEDGARAKAMAIGMNYLEDAIPALAEAMDSDVAAEYANAGDSVDATGGALAANDILNVDEEMNLANVPMDGRQLVVHPTDAKQLKQESNFIAHSIQNTGGDLLTEARLGKYYGFDVHMSNNIVTTSGPRRHNMAFHRNAIALSVRLLPKPEDANVMSTVVYDTQTGLAMRYQRGYDILSQTTIHTLDILYGVATVDDRLLWDAYSGT